MILSLETSTNSCSVALHCEGKLLGFVSKNIANSHSALLPTIVDKLLNELEISKKRLDAIAISGGPGSYTGLRIGTSVAKGLAFGLGIPLISVSTLQILIQPYIDPSVSRYLVPMLDARRMEVYLSVWDVHGQRIWDDQPLIIEEDSLSEFSDKPLILIGNGATKTEGIFKKGTYMIENNDPEAQHMGILAFAKFEEGLFENLDLFEPMYLKSFIAKKPKDLLKT